MGRAPSWFAVGWLMVVAVLAGCASHGEAVSSCSSSPVAVTEAGSIASGSEDGSCEGATDLITWSDGAAGSACTDPTQFRPTCCALAGHRPTAVVTETDLRRARGPESTGCPRLALG
jgi:hypothetical protein